MQTKDSSFGSVTAVAGNSDEAGPLAPGRVLGGRYRIERQLSQGSMGWVYLATQLPLGRLVAVKILRTTGQMSEPRFAKRFHREASIASQLSHPNIVSVYDYGEAEQGQLFMVMEHLSGRSLLEVLLREGPLPAERALAIAIQIARALRRAHTNGIVHRDLKPSNVMISTDEEGTDFAKVLDFGLVKVFAPEDSDVKSPFVDDRLTRAGTLVGTPEYVAPEQALGDVIDDRVDVYSLGVTLYHMIAGRVPFRGESILDVITQHLQAEVPAIRDVTGVFCPPEIESVIQRAMRKVPEDRYASMNDLLRDLKRAWRHLTDESYGTDTISPDMLSSVVPVRGEPAEGGISSTRPLSAAEGRDLGRGPAPWLDSDDLERGAGALALPREDPSSFGSGGDACPGSMETMPIVRASTSDLEGATKPMRAERRASLGVLIILALALVGILVVSAARWSPPRERGRLDPSPEGARGAEAPSARSLNASGSEQNERSVGRSAGARQGTEYKDNPY